MSDKRYVFTNADDVVVQAIDGDLSEFDLEIFMRDYDLLFGAKAVYISEPSIGIMAGWTLVDGEFVKPEIVKPEEI